MEIQSAAILNKYGSKLNVRAKKGTILSSVDESLNKARTV